MSHRTFRDRDKKSATNFWRLPVHLYDRALFDAADTMKRWIEAAITQAHLKGKIARAFSGAQRHYAFWLLMRYERIGAVLRGEAPPPEFEIPPEERKVVVRLMRRLLRKALGRPPRVRLRRSFELDSTLYRFFLHKGKPYLAIASMTPRKRIVIPLKGFPVKAAGGNVRVVIHPASRTVTVHIAIPVRARALPEKKEPVAVGLDAGVTEVFTRDDGEVFGQGFGRVLDRLTEETTSQGRERSRLHARAKMLAQSPRPEDRRKAGRILRFNLGQRKLEARAEKGQAEVRRRISEALHGVLAGRSRRDRGGGSLRHAGPHEVEEAVAQGVAVDAVGAAGAVGVSVRGGRFPP